MACVHRRPARVRDDRDTPLFPGPEWVTSNKIPNSNKEKYFVAGLLTPGLDVLPDG
jgi:hypothetical protein